MGLLTNMLGQLGRQQNAPALPALGSLQKTSPATPSPFQASSLPWQQQLAGAIDYGSAGGDAWNTIGRDGVINYMGDSLMKKYGTNNLSDFRYIEAPGIPGGYKMDWAGRQEPGFDFRRWLNDAGGSIGVNSGAPTNDASDGSPMEAGNPADALNFGVTWEGEGGTTFGFYRKPDGSVGIKTNQTQSNETGDIISALAVLGGGIMAGGGLGALGTTAGVGPSAAGGAAATMGAAGAQGVLPASYFAGAGSALGAGAGMAGGAIGDSAMDIASQEAMNAYGGSTGMDAAQQAGIESMTQSGIPTSMPTATDYSQYTQQLGGSPSTPGTFNPAMDSQAANVAIDAAGGSALSGYQAGGIPSVTVNGAAGGGGTSLFDSLASKVGNMEMKDWLGLASTVGGALSGGQGQEGSSSSTRSMDPRMDSLFYGDLAPKTQGLLNSTVPQAQLAGAQLMSKGSGLLGQTAPNTATNPYATGILDDMQRRQQEMIARSLQQTKGNFVGVGGLGGSRQGIAESDAITRGAENFAGQGLNFMGGLYNQDQNRLRQDWTIGSGLVNQGINTPFQPAQNASQIYAPFTGYGTTTNNTQQGGGWQGMVGGALAGATLGRNLGWW